MKLAVLFSGGKDSMLSLIRAQRYHEISCLITIRSKRSDSYMFHTPNIHLTELQAKALNKPLITQWTNGYKEEELLDLKKALIKSINDFSVDGIVTGAIRSVYQATRVQRLCDELGLWCFNPLWLENQEVILKEVLNNNIKAIISSVAGYPLKKDLLGKELNNEIINELISYKNIINPAGEGGEIETTVIDSPLFNKKIVIRNSITSYENYSGTYLISDAELIDK